MKKITKYLSILLISTLLFGCDNSLERSKRTIDALQDNMTQIINILNEIQNEEENIQRDFEATLNSEDGLTAFGDENSAIQINVSEREYQLGLLSEQVVALEKYIEEFTTFTDAELLDRQEVIQQIDLFNQLQENLAVYSKDYQANIQSEQQIYYSLSDPEIDYNRFYQIFEQIETLMTTNHINLEKILGYFEPINTQLINFKIYLVNLAESKE